MINGKIVDTSVWINYLNNVINDQTNITVSLIKKDEIFILPVIVQEVLQGSGERMILNLQKPHYWNFHFYLTSMLKWQYPLHPFTDT